MPVIRASKYPDPIATARASIVNIILKELLGEGNYDGPVIFEVPTPEPNRVNPLVVWEGWRGVPPRERPP